MAQKKQDVDQTASVKTEKTEVERDREPVTGVFRYYEIPGARFTFMYRKHPGEPIEKYDFMDGETYTIPRGVAEHLNQNCWYPEHEYLQNEDGTPATRIGRKVPRVGFQSLDFMSNEHRETTIYTAEKV